MKWNSFRNSGQGPTQLLHVLHGVCTTSHTFPSKGPRLPARARRPRPGVTVAGSRFTVSQTLKVLVRALRAIARTSAALADSGPVLSSR